LPLAIYAKGNFWLILLPVQSGRRPQGVRFNRQHSAPCKKVDKWQ
jgi:hypothetical protein